MFETILRYFQKRKRIFKAFQIEITTYCPLQCQMCPRKFFAEEWIFKHMPMETFQRISRYFHMTEWVHLQGWGEPLENENLVPMLNVAKQAGCLTSFTTNGVLLTEDISQKLLAEDIDLIVVSLGGATKENHEKLRIGSHFEQILDNVKKLVDLKKKLNVSKPRVKLSNMMTKLNIRELPAMIPLAAELGVDEVMVMNIDYLAAERSNLLRTFYHESPSRIFQDSIDEMHRVGKAMGIPVTTYPLKVEEVAICECNPLKNIFFSVDGSVSPCVYLKIPKKGDITRIFYNQEYLVPQTLFGNVTSEDFYDIWNKDSYKNFRKPFANRRTTKFNLVVNALLNANPSSSGQNMNRKLPPLPDVCQTCYKAYGI